MKLHYVGCQTCLAIRSGRRSSSNSLTDTYFRALADDDVPAEVLLHAEMEMLHATHHDESALRDGEAILMLGFRVILSHYLEADIVPRQDMVTSLNEQSARHHAEIDGAKAAARQEVLDHNGADLRELRIRVANVEALASRAFFAKHKTMRTDEVRAAIDWRTGDEVPEATRAEAARVVSALR